MSEAQDVRVNAGWAVLDGRGRVWGKAIFASEAAAVRTAEQCITGQWSVAKAKRIQWLSLRPGNKIASCEDTIVVEGGTPGVVYDFDRFQETGACTLARDFPELEISVGGVD